MEYGHVDDGILGALRDALGPEAVLVGDDMLGYDHDETEDFSFPPEVVVRPERTEEVQAVLRLASQHRIPVTPRGGGTSLSGGALALHGGIVLSLERMNRILEIDERNLFAVVEAGVITGDLHRSVESRGLFYPPDPASLDSCTIGGNLVVCAGGPRAVKYGVTKDYVYGLKAVLPDGTAISAGGKLVKNVSGYNLVQLLIGSEGTLAVVTEVTVKLLPLPRLKRTFLVPYATLDGAAGTVSKLLHEKIVPTALEFMERAAIEASAEHLGLSAPFGGEAEALLLIAVDGNHEQILDEEVERIGELCLEHGAVDVLLAQGGERERELWRLRRAIGEAVKSRSPYRELDTVVPRSRIPELVRTAREVTAAHGLEAISYGHAGDGNLHVNILKGEMERARWDAVLPRVTEELFTRVVEMGGTISGEHGIGYVQKDALPLALRPRQLELMREIKRVFDPQGILNPGKVFDLEPASP